MSCSLTPTKLHSSITSFTKSSARYAVKTMIIHSPVRLDHSELSEKRERRQLNTFSGKFILYTFKDIFVLVCSTAGFYLREPFDCVTKTTNFGEIQLVLRMNKCF